jgi:hypothetical protein
MNLSYKYSCIYGKFFPKSDAALSIYKNTAFSSAELQSYSKAMHSPSNGIGIEFQASWRWKYESVSPEIRRVRDFFARDEPICSLRLCDDYTCLPSFSCCP